MFYQMKIITALHNDAEEIVYQWLYELKLSATAPKLRATVSLGNVNDSTC